MTIFPARKRCRAISRRRGFAASALLLVACAPFAAMGQISAQQAAANPLAVFPGDRVTAPIANQATAILAGSMHPMARPENDAGPVPGDFPMAHMILTLTRDASQQTALDAYSAALQNPQSPYFHKWLTAESFGAHFGLSQNDLNRIADWLKGLGFTVDDIPSGHWTITFSGTAAQVENAFHTSIRYYRVAGEVRHANSSDPQIPQALAGIVSGVTGLHNFRARHVGANTAGPAGGGGGGHYLDPSDFATIYNLNPVYNKGIKGNGVTIAVIEDCSMDVSLAQTYWGLEGLTQNSNAYWDYGTPPACAPSDYDEVFLDYEWSGAVAPQAQIWLVSSSASDSIFGAVQGVVEHGVNNGFAHLITLSYEDCEGAYDKANWAPVWLQAHTQGITGLVASGDIGAAACDYPGSAQTATHGRAVNGLCASPYVVCVGGTQFDDVANSNQYWSATTGHALGYIAEIAWNESGKLGNSPSLWGSSGGGYSTIQQKGSWQTGNTGTQRGEPDVALSSASHDGYRICIPISSEPCASNYNWEVAGTSAAAPSFAGIMALVIQATGQNQGSPNQTLYGLAAQPALGVFHDIVSGNNSVNGVVGYSATQGWDPVTGLGSVDATALVDNWPGSHAAVPAVTLSTSQLSFGNQVVNTVSASQTVTLTNSGSAALSLSSIGIAGTNTHDFIPNNHCGNSVAAGAGCSITVAFEPTATGARTASLTIADNAAGSPQSVALSGNGTTPSALPPFSNQRVTTAAPATGTSCPVPPAVSSFLTTDNNVYLFFDVTVTTADTLSLNWLAPNGDVVSAGAWLVQSGNVCLSAQLNISSPKPGHFGAWQAAVYDNGTPLFAVPFTITAPGRSPLQFGTVPPCRIMDTRTPAAGGTFPANSTFGSPNIAAGTVRTIPILSGACPVPSGTAAYSLNFTVVPRTKTLGSLTVWPTGSAQPNVSTLTSPDGSVLAAAAIVPAGTGSINAYATDDTDLVVDINGFFAPPASYTLQFYPLPPCRVLDTRLISNGGSFPPNSTFGSPSLDGVHGRSYPIPSSSCGVPARAAAYSFNLTAVPHGGLGFVTAWPTGQTQPFVSTMNSYDGTVLANAAIVPAGTAGAVSFFASNPTDLAVDINGYFAPPGSGGLNFYTVSPCRLVDTSQTNGTFGGPAIGALATRNFPLSQGPCGLPASPALQAYSLSITASPQGPLGYLSTWPAGGAQPFVSTLNGYKGQAMANAAIVPAGSPGSISVFVTTASNVTIDTAGYFGP